MKKLAIAQIVLGIFVVGSLFAWMVWLSNGYHQYEGIVPGSDTVIRIFGLLKPNPLMDVWMVAYLVLGLAVLGCGIAQFVKAKRQVTDIADEPESGVVKLADTQIVLGALIIGLLVWFIGWIEYGYSPITKLYQDVEVVMRPSPGWIMQLISWKVTSFLLGLSVLGCGIAQFIKARRWG